MKVIVGLGNPGPKYANTRHNVGFDAVDYLAKAPGVAPFRGRFQALVTELQEGGEAVLLVKPETFMNLSGRAVRQVVDFYKLTPEQLLVVSDDFNLPLGKLRARGAGSAGGQNGLKNIQECLGTDGYPRLRIGVGSPKEGEAVDFVLGRFKPSERKEADDAVARAAEGALLWVREGLEACMNRVNGGPAEAKKPRPNPPAPFPQGKGEKIKKQRPDSSPPSLEGRGPGG